MSIVIKMNSYQCQQLLTETAWMRTQDLMFVTQSTIDQKKNGRQVISSQITKDSASTSSAHGFVLFSG